MTPSVAIVVWILGLVSWAVIRLPHQLRANRIKVVAHRRTIADRLALLAAGLGLAIIPLLYVATKMPASANYAFQPVVGWSGLVVQIIAQFLFFVSHRQLGKNWSVTLEIRETHKLVTEGLYRYVRHPMYSSFWLWALAQALLLSNWVAGLSGLVGVTILYFYRVGKEEALMRGSFGPEYDAYSERTGRIVPRLSLRDTER